MNSMPHKTLSSMLQLKDIPTSIAWTFTHLLSGTFKRNRPAFAHHDYPILAPLPDRKTQTRPQNNAHAKGPFIYFVTDARGHVCYVGKSEEEHILRRWIRPGRGGPPATTGLIRRPPVVAYLKLHEACVRELDPFDSPLSLCLI